MAITLKPAVNYIKPMKVLSYGPAYSGKTLSSLNVAVGIVQVFVSVLKQKPINTL